MRAVGYQQPLPIEDSRALLDIEIPIPTASGRDVLVEVKAISVNPVDVKVRARTQPTDGEYKILGFDAAGVVKAVGSEVTLFRPADEVYYAGSHCESGHQRGVPSGR